MAGVGYCVATQIAILPELLEVVVLSATKWSALIPERELYSRVPLLRSCKQDTKRVRP